MNQWKELLTYWLDIDRAKPDWLKRDFCVMGIASTTSAPSWCFFTGLALRVFLFLAPAVTRWLSGRVELNTAVNSWKRVIEAVALDKAGISPYGRFVGRDRQFGVYVFEWLIGCFGEGIVHY